ncbi:MAG: hypothetical protein NZ901_03520 [Geminocystis sp.]|nr:hypothetical protein [Geminocystis sp.]HIK37699.1 hypothetical protein [Geminocystis sp. M7585_C2015_104]MCS7147240.1 hypothetical protein [Geminocystis sp.]MCX8078535.1 hypothetical protein [Geminocystis sp.]MDW8116236.1 hypothetical protein [Geminocystis sp.]
MLKPFRLPIFPFSFFLSLFLLLTSILTSIIVMPPAIAAVPIKITDVSYKECPPGVGEGSVTSGGNTMPATCYLITGKAHNNSGKTLYDADVFGRVYDANNEPILQNRGRLGSIAEVPPGVSDFEIRISVPSNQPTPLRLQQFKATGFTARVTPSF